jgi:hypothetical protein
MKKSKEVRDFILTNFLDTEDGATIFLMLEKMLGTKDLLAEFRYFAEERQDKEDFVVTIKEICRSRADDLNEQADRLEMLLQELRSKNSYTSGDRPKINYPL